MQKDLEFVSRKSPVVCRNGCVACAQPLAANIGLDILKHGGNAADAAVAMAAAMNVTQPSSTGIGGDAFCLFYDSSTKTVKGLNGSGRAPAALTLSRMQQDGFYSSDQVPMNHGHTVTVPGAAAAWVDTHERFGSGRLTLNEILAPAIKLAEEGYPVSQITAHEWKKGAPSLQLSSNTFGQDLLINGQPPRWGQVMKMPHLANTFKLLADKGKQGFYEGAVAESIVACVSKFGGVMTLEDLKNHCTTFEDPISVDYKGVRVWEIPPNGQGITALMALNILEGFDVKSMGHNSAQYLHTLIEALRLAFADSLQFCADPSKVDVPIEQLLSKRYGAKRRALVKIDKVLDDVHAGSPCNSSDTVYFTVVDSSGNACSFINSNYTGFGTGLVPEKCGFTLQNRGLNFSLEPGHPNVVAPNKRPYHTIIPAMVTDAKTGSLLASYGVMGGFMQPQGHVQVLLNMKEFGMNPQQALDQPRLLIGPGHRGAVGGISLEDGISEDVIQQLQILGHQISGPTKGYNRSIFGRGHVITKGAWWSTNTQTHIANDESVLWAGSDPRSDGMAAGY